MNEESMWKAVHRMESALSDAQRQADRIEEAVRQLRFLFEDGYGSRALEFLEELRKFNEAKES